MKQLFKRILALALTLVLTAGLAAPLTVSAEEPCGVTKLMDSCTANGQTYTLNENSRIFVVAAEAPTEDLLQTAQLVQQELAAGGWPDGQVLSLVWGPKDAAENGDIILKLDPAAGLAAGGYKMNVARKAVITACDTDGLLYGAHTLMMCFRSGNSLTVQGFRAQREPGAKERTVHLDVARKYYTPEWIKNFIRQMSWMGYNALELHVSDDGGFRADFWDDTYYTDGFRPKNDFSWLCGSRVQYWVADPYRNDPDAGKYLSTAELIDICNTAKQYHIDIIPSFDTPGHTNYLCWKFEQHYMENNNSYSFQYEKTPGNFITVNANKCSGKIYAYKNMEGEKKYRTIELTDPGGAPYAVGRRFALCIYSDMADFFRVYAGSTRFNIGGDEVDETGSSWTYPEIPRYTGEISALLDRKGYTCRMFNDFVGAPGHTDYYSQMPQNMEYVYWNSGFNPNNGNKTANWWSAEDFSNHGCTVYNGIQTSTYYVLRVTADGVDARDPANRFWPFYASTEDRIFSEWKPAYIGAKGDHNETVNPIPADKLGGSYFMIWNDYAALNTEQQVWEGTTYSLFNRMWSNIAKAWNANLDGSMSYDEFSTVRDQLGFFPGYTSCSAAVTLPAATDIIEDGHEPVADHRALNAALANVKENIGYTEDSWNHYQEAITGAEAINSDYASTQDQVDEALRLLQEAEAALILRGDHTDLAAALANVKENIGYTEDSWNKYQEAVRNAEAVNQNVNATQDQVDEALRNLQTADAGLTTLNAPEVTVILKCGEAVVREQVFILEKNQIEFCLYIPREHGYKVIGISGGSYLPLASGDGSGFVTGQTQSMRAKIILTCEAHPDTGRLQYLIDRVLDSSLGLLNLEFYNQAMSEAEAYLSGGSLLQSEIDAFAANLEKGRTGLTAPSDKTEIIKIEPLAASFNRGCQIGLRITTTPDIAELTVDGVETLTICTGEIQKLTNGGIVKIWLVEFPAETAGEQTFTIRGGTASKTIEVSVF